MDTHYFNSDEDPIVGGKMPTMSQDMSTAANTWQRTWNKHLGNNPAREYYQNNRDKQLAKSRKYYHDKKNEQ